LAYAFYSSSFAFLSSWLVLAMVIFSVWFGFALFFLLNLDVSRYHTSALYALFVTFSVLFAEFLFVIFLVPVSVYFQAVFLFLIAVCLAEYARIYLLPRHLP
jgi:hypothetical protein